jgi:hypothetical protein
LPRGPPRPWLRIGAGAFGRRRCGLRRHVFHWASHASTSGIGIHLTEVLGAIALIDAECRHAIIEILLGYYLKQIIEGCDTAEEYLACNIWPLSDT